MEWVSEVGDFEGLDFFAGAFVLWGLLVEVGD
jgi:hypothetical protein